LDTRSVTAAMHLGVWPVVRSTHLGSVSLQSSSLSAAAAEETTLKTIVVAVSGKKRRRPLQSERKGSAADRIASPRACQHPNQLQLSFLPNRTILALTGIKLSQAAASSRLRLHPVLHPFHSTQEGGPSGRLPQRVANVRTLVLKCRWWNPATQFQTDWFNTLSPTGSVSTRGDRRSPREPTH
jgi:hypothetical protein